MVPHPQDKERLEEKRFIHEGYSSDPATLWLWLAIMMAVVLVMWGGRELFQNYLQEVKEERPFLDVTNRQISLFLWQNPHYMRVKAASKSAYLPGFQYVDKVSVEPEMAEQIVQAPPELLFRYHAWSRLVQGEMASRAIPEGEFSQFLDYATEWQPKSWAAAPKPYRELVSGLNAQGARDLAALSDQVLPSEVRVAFIGWKNYTKEAEAIAAFKPTYGHVQELLSHFPHYARNYWQNIVDSDTDSYIPAIAKAASKEEVPPKEMASFLRIAIFNLEQAKRGS